MNATITIEIGDDLVQRYESLAPEELAAVRAAVTEAAEKALSQTASARSSVRASRKQAIERYREVSRALSTSLTETQKAELDADLADWNAEGRTV